VQQERHYAGNCKPGSNKAPIANAGDDITITLPTNSTSLNGIGTDMDGTITNYQWTKYPVLPLQSVMQPQHSYSKYFGTRRISIELIVTDNSGATGKDTLQVTVNRHPTRHQKPMLVMI